MSGKLTWQVPLHVYKRQQARISRKSLYKTSAFYTSYAMIVLVFACRSKHPIQPPCLRGRHGVVHSRRVRLTPVAFPGIEGYLHKLFHSVHTGHHDNPLDVEHINGDLRDLLPLFFLARRSSEADTSSHITSEMKPGNFCVSVACANLSIEVSLNSIAFYPIN
jgi:hypothetical protein